MTFCSRGRWTVEDSQVEDSQDLLQLWAEVGPMEPTDRPAPPPEPIDDEGTMFTTRPTEAPQLMLGPWGMMDRYTLEVLVERHLVEEEEEELLEDTVIDKEDEEEEVEEEEGVKEAGTVIN